MSFSGCTMPRRLFPSHREVSHWSPGVIDIRGYMVAVVVHDVANFNVLANCYGSIYGYLQQVGDRARNLTQTKTAAHDLLRHPAVTASFVSLPMAFNDVKRLELNLK
ncbi:hypothetical protein QAD02_016079 [Eretmocerus hayati]|uniref:Uncharacterized protein n=1 Tax=Eretmocerus hayati TaxID=131215 RepID=A0ACC2PCZ2_9HYME|nr:hypothetical protein QAD02_016079 [Eretmocerus hayati]